MSTDYARSSSAPFNWAAAEDRVFIQQNLRVNAEALTDELANARNATDRLALLKDLQRVYARLAVCDIWMARVVEGRLLKEKRREGYVVRLLERMAAALDMAFTPDNHSARVQLAAAKDVAGILCEYQLDGWFPTGPWAALGLIANTVADMDIDAALDERKKFAVLVGVARRIPESASLDDARPEAKAFRKGLDLLNGCLGLHSEDRDM